MAYYVNYRFQFASEQGTDVRIDILGLSSPSGGIKNRAVGRNTVLRRDRSDNVFGTSLELLAECAVDGEFEEFRTAGPTDWKVEVYVASTLAWTGFITPDVMDSPDIAPPYDVVLTATDGLGLLKESTFQAAGRKTISEHVTSLLALSGLDLSLFQITDLRNSVLNAPNMIYNTKVNLDHMVGETCYDVLQVLLGSLHMTVTQYHGRWLLVKETGMSLTSTKVTAYNGTTSSSLSVDHFGSMADHQSGWWPVGNLINTFVPANKRLTLTAENHYIANLFDDAEWEAVASGSDGGDYWSLDAAGDGLKQSLTFANEISQRLLLSIKVRNVGSGANAGHLSVKVKATGRSYSANTVFYLADGSMARRNAATNYSWASTEQACSVEVQAPDSSDTDSDFVTIEIVLPFFHNSARDYFYVTSLEVTLANGDGTYPQRVYGVSLSKYETVSGYRKIVEISNGARNAKRDIELGFASIADTENAFEGAEELISGVPTGLNYRKITGWYSTDLSTELDYLSFMARDYALSLGVARIRKRGTLNVPVGKSYVPVLFRNDVEGSGTSATPYLVETYEWRLCDDELSVEMISLPATSITVSSEGSVQGETTNATSHSQAPVSTPGGGGGGPVTSVGLSIPTYFDISGSPVTGSGTLTATLKSSYKIPSSTEWTAVDNAKHSHSNKGTLDGITSQKVSNWDAAYTSMAALDISLTDKQHWDAAYSAAHSHSNWSVINGISANDVSSWNSAAGYAHYHTNLTVLDGITSQKVSAWDAAAAASAVTVSVGDGGTSAAPAVQVGLSNGSSDSWALPMASSSQAGIVSNGNQTFGGYKTFDRIYVGNSEARGAYIEWDDTARAWKFVGDFYATGEVAAGN